MRQEKKQLVQDIREILESTSDLFLISYKGLTAAEFGELRTSLAEIKSGCRVVPNRLFRQAASEAGLDELAAAHFADDTAVVTAVDDPVGLAKKLRAFAKVHRAVSFRLGVVGGKVCSSADAMSLASLPPKEVLQAQLAGLLHTPVSRVPRILHAKVASIMYVLNAHLRKKEQAA